MITLQKPQLSAATALFVRAFAADPLYAYFIPAVEARTAFMEKFFAFRLKFGFAKGEVTATSERLESVAIWTPPGVNIQPADLILKGGLSAILSAGKDAKERILSFNNEVDSIIAEVASEPHWYLTPIATDPTLWGKGFAGSLLDAKINDPNRTAPIFLETQQEKNVSFYNSHGFHLLDSRLLASANLVNYSMLHE